MYAKMHELERHWPVNCAVCVRNSVGGGWRWPY